MDLKNPMNIKDPIRKYSISSKLKNGTEVMVKGFVFDHPVFLAGDPPVFNMITIVNMDKVVIGIRFYATPMTMDLLMAEVELVGEEPDFYLTPMYKMQMDN